MSRAKGGVSLLSVEVILLIALQVSATAVLWLLNPITQSQTDTFALFLSVDLLAFATLSYQYRTRKYGRIPSQAWLAVGYLLLIVLLTSDLILR
jgi:hypothetical protein